MPPVPEHVRGIRPVSLITRRTLLGGALALPLCPCHAAVQDEGCVVEGRRADEILATIPRIYSFAGAEPELIATSGNHMLDKAFSRSLFTLSRDFGVLPGLGFHDGEAAYATNAVRMNLSDGTVAIGKRRMNRLLQRPQGDAYVVAITAHEFGHILQFKRGLHAKLEASVGKTGVEHHADFLSGWFAGLRKLKNDKYPAAHFATIASESGGGSHGTGEERAAAVQAGFLAAARDKLSIDEAVEVGMRHVGVHQQAPVVPHRQ